MSLYKKIAMCCLIAGALSYGASASAGLFGTKKGKGGSDVQGSAGPDGSADAPSDLERCEKPMGAIAVVELQSAALASLSRYKLSSPTGLIRMLIQQSNCFIVVERGVGMQNVMQERSLAGSGQLRQGSNMGEGQMVTADFVLTPNVVFSENNAGGIGGAVGGLFGKTGRAFGALAGGVKFKEAQTSMLVADTRSGVQVAAAEGSAKDSNFSLGGLLIGGGGGGALGGYGNTNEGKVIAASYADNFNQIVRAIRGQPSLVRDVGTLAEEAGTVTKAGETFNEGDILRPKIGNVKLYATPGGSVIVALGKTENMIFMGAEQDGYLNVESEKGGGWVKAVLVTH